MPNGQDFERAWLEKFSTGLDRVAGQEIREEIMRGSERLSSLSSQDQIIEWSRQAMERLDLLLDQEGCREVMTGCACQYPRSALQEIRKRYEETRDTDLAHQMLQEQFESFLHETLQLDDDLVQEIVRRGWGLAGVKNGKTIIATKIPKSGYLAQYMQEKDPQVKRQIYCHCPRIREVLKGSETISATYCYCGAGFYQGIWEEILQEPVEVELLESVMQGDEVCQVAILLP
jgi:hypothetical protein